MQFRSPWGCSAWKVKCEGTQDLQKSQEAQSQGSIRRLTKRLRARVCGSCSWRLKQMNELDCRDRHFTI